MLSQLFERTLNSNSGHVEEIAHNPELAFLIKLQLARKLAEDEIDGSILPSRILGPLKEVEFEKDGEHFLCTPRDSIGVAVRMPSSRIEFCYFEYPLAFKRLAELNGFTPTSEFMFGGKSLYHIGDLVLSIGRIGWYFLNECNESCLQGLSSLSYEKILISSHDERVKQLCQKRGFTFVSLPSIEKGVKLNPTSFLNKSDGVSALEMARLTGIPLLLDTQTQSIFFYGVEAKRNLVNDYKYLYILTTIGKNGMTLLSLFSAMELQGHDASGDVSEVRRKLKGTVKKTFSDDPGRMKECLQALGLPVEKGDSRIKGSSYRLNLSSDQIIIY